MKTLAGLSTWATFERESPEMAAAGRALLYQGQDVAIGFLATQSAECGPALAPVCPIFCDDWIHLSVGARTPKRRDLDLEGRFALHAFLGGADAEFRIEGVAERLEAAGERRRVQTAIPFRGFDPEDPVYRLWLGRCLYGYWENVGRPDTRPVRRWWRPGRT